jgi:TM2 domain-containing membrane protein YozV
MSEGSMKSKYTALILGWLVPGLGHFYAGKRQKGIVFLVAIMASAITGLAIGNFRNVYFAADHYQFYAEIGNGLFTLAGSFLMKVSRTAPIESAANAAFLAGIAPIGDLYLMVAGLLNFIVAANAFDVVAAANRGTK